ncbi:MAG: hypothetical protein ACOC2B_07455 [Sediminispirochaetaceae bacterium]
MDALTKAIEGELEKAFPVQDREALHRCSRLISEELVQHHHYNSDIAKIHADIKHIIEKMDDRFAAMDKRFDELIHQMDTRFAAMDTRFDELIHQMDKRFEAMDKRFDDLIHYMDKRFEANDKRLEAMQHETDKRFDSIDRRFTHMFRFMTLGFTILAMLLTVFNFL